jgi:hypothetical protein
MRAYQLSRLCLFVLFLSFYHQNYAQSLLVHCTDAETLEDLVDATVVVQFDNQAVTSSTDHLGVRKLDNVRYPLSIEVHYTGYESVKLDLATDPGKAVEVGLSSHLVSCPVIVRAPGMPILQPDMLSRNEALRLPAMFFDPARVAATRPGVLQTNDGTNALSVHGLHPELIRWRIHELDVVNPNHLPNAGTFSDRAAQGGGGVFLVSSQALGATRWHAGDLPMGVGDAVAGLVDIHLRDGGDRHRRTVQAGLLGLDLALDGSFRDAKWRYLANYRYSTVGVLSRLGVSFGGEAIAFQDFNFNLTRYGQSGRQVRFFALAGRSTNDFTGDTTKTDRVARDFSTVNYLSRTGIAGFDALLPFGGGYTLAVGAAGSAQLNSRQEAQPLYQRISDEAQEESRMSTKGRLSKTWFGAGEVEWSTGWNSSFLRLRQMPDSATARLGTLIFQPFSTVQWSRRVGGWVDQFGGELGLHNLSVSAVDAFEPQPRAKIFFTKSSSKWTIAAGRQAQMPLYTNLLIPNVRERMQPMQAWMYSLGHQWTYYHYRALYTKARVFYQTLDRLPLAEATGIASPVEGNVITQFAGYGRGRSYGTDLEFGTNRDGDFSYSANLSVFNTTLTDLAGARFNSRYNTGFICNLLAERSWNAIKATGKRTRSLSARVVVAGGQRYTPVSDTQTGSFTNYDLQNYGKQRGPVYFRSDIRYQRIWQRSPRKFYTLSFEVQNLSLRKNLDYYYFEPLTMAVTKKYQLGLVPNVNWRWEF